MENGIAVAGNLIVDYIKYIDSYPARQSLTTITEVTRSTGGLCCNCSMVLAKLDPCLPVKAVGFVGEDEAGDFVLSRFGGFPNVDTSLIKRHGVTSFTDVMTERLTGKRTFFHNRGANARLGPEHFDFSAIKADILHIGYILLLDRMDEPDADFPTAMCRVLDSAQKAGILTSIDVVSEEGERFIRLVPPALKYTDYCVVNELEASKITSVPLRDDNDCVLTENLFSACQRLIDMGVRRWAVVHMPELSCGMAADGTYVSEYSWDIPEGFKKSSVGAGDAFASGILYSAYNGRSLKDALHMAGAVAAYSLSGAGGADSIRPLPEILKEMEGFQK